MKTIFKRISKTLKFNYALQFYKWWFWHHYKICKNNLIQCRWRRNSRTNQWWHPPKTSHGKHCHCFSAMSISMLYMQGCVAWWMMQIVTKTVATMCLLCCSQQTCAMDKKLTPLLFVAHIFGISKHNFTMHNAQFTISAPLACTL